MHIFFFTNTSTMKSRQVMAILMVALPALSHATHPEEADADSLFRYSPASNLRDVVVTGTRTPSDVRHLSQTVSVVGRTELTEHQRPNVLPTLTEQVPSLFVTSRGLMGYGVSGGAAGGLNLRGIASGSGQLLVLIDGHPQYQGIFGHSIADSYQTLMAERVEVLRGPASMLYGSNAMGGVVNIVTRGMATDGVRTHINLGAGSYGTIQGEVSNQVHKGRFTSTVAAQYGRSDNHRANMGFDQYGGFVKLGYDLSSHWHLFADADVTHFNASNPGTITSPLNEANQWITRSAVAAGVENHYANTNGALSLYDNYGRHKINDGYGPTSNNNQPQTELFRSKDAVAGVSWYQSARLFKGNRTTVGLDYQHIYGRAYYTSRETGEVVTTGRRMMQSAHAHENEVGAYVDFRQDITSWLTVDAGIRYDHHSTAGGEWVPQAGLVWRPLADGELKASFSKGFRNPTNREMYLYGTANHDSLRAERLLSYELSWRQRLCHGRFSYGINLFLIDADNLIQTVAGRNINTGELKNKGIEVEADWRVNSHWLLTTNHSYLDMENPVVGAPTYKGYLGARFNQAKWQVSAGLQQLCGLYTAVGAAEQKEDATLLNATVAYQLHQNVGLWVKGENLLGQHYEVVQGYPMPKATFMAGVNVRF